MAGVQGEADYTRSCGRDRDRHGENNDNNNTADNCASGDYDCCCVITMTIYIRISRATG